MQGVLLVQRGKNMHYNVIITERAEELLDQLENYKTKL